MTNPIPDEALNSHIGTWTDLEAKVRQRWGRLTPYRLGLVVGEFALSLNPPAGKSKRWHEQFNQGAHWSRSRRPAPEQPTVVAALVAMERSFGRDEGYHYTREQVAAVGLARRALCEHFNVKAATEPCTKVQSQTHG